VRYEEALGLSPYDADVIVADPNASELLETLVREGVPAKEAANWVSGEYLRLLRKYGEGVVPRVAGSDLGADLAGLVRLVLADGITRTNAKEVFETAFTTGRSPAEIIEERGFVKISDADAVGRVVDEVVASNPAAVADYRAGKGQAMGFLVGQVMKATGGQANAALAAAAIRERLER
jgi:aspartyl-tRNA(Asn)/glutamyl-tRNA(Gln) amidotransferase subunit B